MKLYLLKRLSRLLDKFIQHLKKWKDEVDWAVIANTPVGPNPHEKGTLSWFLHEEGNKLRASHRIRKKIIDGPSPWVALAKKKTPPL